MKPGACIPLLVLSLLVNVIGGWGIASLSRAEEAVFPGKAWSVTTPQEVGLAEDKLDAFALAIGGDGVIIRNGYLVKQWGQPQRRGDWASSAKPVISTLLLFAVEEGQLPSVDAPVRPWVQKRFPGKDLSDKDRSMTFRHLANMTSGYSRGEAPGTHWAYNDLAINLYRHVLGEVLGESLNDAALKRLAPLQFSDGDLFGSRGGAGVNTSPRDFARLGWWWLNQGNWNGQQLLPKKYFEEYLRPDVRRDLPRTTQNGSDTLEIGSYGGGNDQDFFGQGVYGFNWWFNAKLADRDELFLPHLPADAFCTIGHQGNEVMLIVPSWQLVVAARGNWGGVRLERTAILQQALLPPAGQQAKQSTAEDTCNAEQPHKSLDNIGEFDKWSKLEVSLTGPASHGAGEPNPFNIALTGLFTSPSGKTISVPGFYDGDGQGGLDGDVWKIRFSADEIGKWSFRSTSDAGLLDGYTGSFQVTPAAADAADFYRWGRLQAVGTAENQLRYLKFADGPYWLKAGCDDPENFLGNYKNYDTLEKRQAAIDYLAERGINSLYIMSHNIDGDDKDVWPWLGRSSREAKSNSVGEVRFDVAKLDDWRALFEHMQHRGVVVYLILEDDSAWKNYDHQRYYREMVARFGYLPGLVFNLGEEANENYKLPQALAYVQHLADVDPYDHPRGIHNVNSPNDAYINAPQIDFTSIQTGHPDKRSDLQHALQHNQLAIDWLRACQQRQQRCLMINFDEGRPEEQRAAWWAAYLAGGVWEAHVMPPYDKPMSNWHRLWTELGGARSFIESLPFWEMQPHNELVKSGQAFCLAQAPTHYALYLPQGGTISLQLPSDENYRVEWWNPNNSRAGQFQDSKTIAGGLQSLTAPQDGDWAARITKL